MPFNLRTHIKFLNDVQNSLDEILNTMENDKSMCQLIDEGYYQLKERDRKTVSKVLLNELSRTINYSEAEIVDLLAQLHATTVMRTVSTTDSDLHDLLYCIDIPNAIRRLENDIAA